MKKKNLSIEDHLQIARHLRWGKHFSAYDGDKILKAVPRSSRLGRAVLKLENILSTLSSELEMEYFRTTTREQRAFPNDLIHYGPPESLDPRMLEASDKEAK